MGTQSEFYYPMTIHRDSVSREVMAPMLANLPSGLNAADEIIILELSVGSAIQGLYVHDVNRWRFSLPMYQISESLVDGVAIDVYIGLTTETSAPANATVYKNGQRQTSLVLAADPSVYVVLTPKTITGSPEIILPVVATSPISGHRVVRISAAGNLAYASSANVGDAANVIGISQNAAVAGGNVNIQSFGPLDEPSWSWTPGLPVFCGVDGVLTQVPPEGPGDAFSLIVGTAMLPTRIYVSVKQPIIVL